MAVNKVWKEALVLEEAVLLSYCPVYVLSFQTVLAEIAHVLAPVEHVSLRLQLLGFDDDDGLFVLPVVAQLEPAA